MVHRAIFVSKECVCEVDGIVGEFGGFGSIAPQLLFARNGSIVCTVKQTMNLVPNLSL